MSARRSAGGGDSNEPLAEKINQHDLLERLTSIAREGRRPLSEFLKLSEDAGEDQLRAVRSFLFDLYCQIYGIEPGSEEEAGVRFKLLKELGRGTSVEEVTNLFISNLYLREYAAKPRPAEEPRARRQRPRSLAERTRQVIEERYTERITLGSLAEELSVSKEHLSRIFKKKFGQTVTEAIHHTRIENAQRLMATERFSLKQVCYETGYLSYNDFYRNFRKVTGVSPKEYLARD